MNPVRHRATKGSRLTVTFGPDMHFDDFKAFLSLGTATFIMAGGAYLAGLLAGSGWGG